MGIHFVSENILLISVLIKIEFKLMAIFQKSVIKTHLTKLDKEQVEKAYQKFKENYCPAKIEKIKQLKEEEYQDGFLN